MLLLVPQRNAAWFGQWGNAIFEVWLQHRAVGCELPAQPLCASVPPSDPFISSPATHKVFGREAAVLQSCSASGHDVWESISEDNGNLHAPAGISTGTSRRDCVFHWFPAHGHRLYKELWSGIYIQGKQKLKGILDSICTLPPLN